MRQARGEMLVRTHHQRFAGPDHRGEPLAGDGGAAIRRVQVDGKDASEGRDVGRHLGSSRGEHQEERALAPQQVGDLGAKPPVRQADVEVRQGLAGALAAGGQRRAGVVRAGDRHPAGVDQRRANA